MLDKALDQIEKSDIEQLVSDKTPEGRTIEYKQELPGNSREEKKESLLDVSSFANATGGCILYGVTEERDGSGKPRGTPEEAKGLEDCNADQEKLRLENMIRTGIRPRIAGVRIRAIEGFLSGPIIVVKVPQSSLTPHLVQLEGEAKYFCARNSSGKYHLDHVEIRSAFAMSADIADRARAFREDRLAKIVADDTPLPLFGKARLVLHLLPLTSLSQGSSLDIGKMKLQSGLLSSTDLLLGGPSFNFDGFFRASGHSGEVGAGEYLQVFRNGAIEFVTCGPFIQDKHLIGSEAIHRDWPEVLKKSLAYYQRFSIDAPVFLLLSIIGVKGYTIYRRESHPDIDRLHGVNKPLDRDSLILPEIMINSFDESLEKAVKPLINQVWQAYGFDGSG